MPDQPKRFQCRHIFTEGRRCGSPCLRNQDFCYYHHTSRKPVAAPAKRRARQGAFHLPFPEDRAAIQLSIGEILRRIAANELDPRRAGLLLYGLQIAQSNLPRAAASTSATGKKRAEPKPDTHVEEIIHHPEHGLIAPAAEFRKHASEKNLEEILMEQWARDGNRDFLTEEDSNQSTTLDTLQAAQVPAVPHPVSCPTARRQPCRFLRKHPAASAAEVPFRLPPPSSKSTPKLA